MFSKFLVTVAVILAAFFFVRQRNLADGDSASRKTNTNKAADKKSVSQTDGHSEFSSDMRIAAYMTVVLMVGLGGTLYYFRWQDDHQIVTVTLHRESEANPISYQVYKFQLQDRSFVTVDGTAVTVAGSERMEVQGLDQ